MRVLSEAINYFYLRVVHNGPNTVMLKTFGGIGDYILLTASLEAYRHLYRGAKIILLCRSSVQDFAINNHDIDGVVLVDYEKFRRNLVERFRTLFSLSTMSIKTYINLDYSATNEKFDNYILDWIHADERVVLQCKESHSVRHYERYTKVVPQEKEWIFEIQRNNEIPKYFGYQPKRLLRGRIWGIEKYRPSTDSLKKIQEEKYYVIFPGSLLEQKKWPADKFAQLIDSTSDLGFLPIICGNSSEKSSGNLIQHLCKTQTVNLMGQTSLMDLAYIIKNARFLISNDTSAVHIAAAVGTPVSVILGGGHYGRFLPYPGIDTVIPVVHEQYRDCFQCYWNCKYGDTRCVKEISVEEMKKNVNYLYNKINH